MKKGQALYQKAKQLIPGGTQLLSKRPEMFLPEVWPSYYSKASGCSVWDLDGVHYSDVSYMGIGANVLGYAFDVVDDAVKEAIKTGSMCTLNAPEEVELAEVLLELHNWADMVRYAKTGGEAMSIAVRIARAHTRKDIVLVCGYHGWHDWYLSANLGAEDSLAGVHLQGLAPSGVPKGLQGSNLIFHYNDIQKFRDLIQQERGNIAAVVMEPIRNDQPLPGFLEEIREITRQEGIVLIFDEISSGFRLCCGGSHLSLDVTPDCAVFAKAMSNGYPMSAIIGTAALMEAAQDTFISSTYWTERVGLVAALATIAYYKGHQVAEHLQKIGKTVQAGWTESLRKHSIKAKVGGIFPLSHFSFEEEEPLACKTFFTQEMLAKGWLASNAFYSSFAHTNAMVQRYLKDCDEVFSALRKSLQRYGSVLPLLKGPICHSGFERLN